MSFSPVRIHLQLMYSQNLFPWQRPLHPWSWLCLHLIACSWKPTPRIKQRVASCHTAEVISIQFTCSIPHTKGTADFWGGWWHPHHVWYGHPHIATDWSQSHCFRFLDIPPLGNGGAQSVDFGSENRQRWGLCVTQIFRGHIWIPIGDRVFQDTPRRVAKFRESRPRDVE